MVDARRALLMALQSVIEELRLMKEHSIGGMVK
jgi:hypothetical protein